METRAQERRKTNRRTLKALFVKPGYQMRLGYLLICLGLAMLCATAFLMYRQLGVLDAVLNQPLAEPAQVQAVLSSVMQSLAMYGLGGFAAFVLVASILGLLINHRVSGPSHALLQIIDQFIAGNYTYRRKLRTRDELKPLQARLEQLGEKLEADRRAR